MNLPFAERTFWDSQGTLVCADIIPVTVDDQPWGAIGFDDCHCERVWGPGEISILTAAVSIVGVTFAQKRTVDELRAATERLEQMVKDRSSRPAGENKHFRKDL